MKILSCLQYEMELRKYPRTRLAIETFEYIRALGFDTELEFYSRRFDIEEIAKCSYFSHQRYNNDCYVLTGGEQIQVDKERNCISYKSEWRDDGRGDVYRHSVYTVLPETIDDFIRDCQRNGIDLESHIKEEY